MSDEILSKLDKLINYIYRMPNVSIKRKNHLIASIYQIVSLLLITNLVN